MAWETLFNYIVDRLLDATPMIPLRKKGRSSVDACMRRSKVHHARNRILAVRLWDDLLVLKVKDVVGQLVVCRGTTKPAFLGSVSPVRIPAVF